MLCFCFSDTDSTNCFHIAGRSTHNASDYINASILAVSAHVINCNKDIKNLCMYTFNYSHSERMHIYNNVMF